MKLKITLVMAGLLALSAAPTVAFEEQTGAPAAPNTAAKASEDTAKAVPGAAQHDYATPDQARSDEDGTEIRIPGLGKLGELPKMDFGLELLYGATETEKVIEKTQDTEETSDDFRIRGTIKHQF